MGAEGGTTIPPRTAPGGSCSRDCDAHGSCAAPVRGTAARSKRFRWWQLATRTLFDLEPAPDGTRPARYTVDVRYLAAELEGGKIPEGSKHAQVSLYRDGVQENIANPPVAFAVPDGVIEVATNSYGLTRMHHVPEGGSRERCTRIRARSKGCGRGSAGDSRSPVR